MFSGQQMPCWQEAAGPTSWHEQALQTFAEIESVLGEILGEMKAAGFPEGDQFAVRLALDEAIVNAVKHGNKHDPGKWVWVRSRVTGESALLEVEDQGPGFNPEGVPDPLAPENLERASGRGLLLMRSFMTWVRHNERGNCITLCKYRSLA